MYFLFFGPSTIFLYNFIFWMIHRAEMPFFEQYKISKEPWPWENDTSTRKGASAQYEWNSLLIRSVITSIFNNSFSIGSALFFYAWLCNWQFPWAWKPSELPSLYKMVKQSLICLLTEDFCFYWVHRLLHCKSKYLPLY